MIHIVHGADTYRTRQQVRELIAQSQRDARSRLLFFAADERDVGLLANELRGGSLFDEIKTIVVRGVLSAADATAYVEYLAMLDGHGSDHTVIVHIDKDLATMGRSTKTSAALKETAKKLIKIGTKHHIKPLSDAERPKWLMEQAVRQFGTVLQPAIANRMAKSQAKSEANSWRLITQLHRLAALSNYTTITPSIYEQYAQTTESDSQNVFPLLDAMAQNSKARALRLIDEQFRKDPKIEFYLLAMFLYQFRILLSIRDLLDRGMNEAQLKEQLDLHPFVIKKNSGIVRRYEQSRLKQLFCALIGMNAEFKFNPAPPRIQLEQFILEL